MTRRVLAVLALALALTPHASMADVRCFEARITGYVRTEYGPYTYDGTPIGSDEPIVAASWDIPLGHYVAIEELGLFRVADRGRLGSSGWIDVAVWSRPEAYALTGTRPICVFAPEELT